MPPIIKGWPEKEYCIYHPNNDQTCVGCALARATNATLDQCEQALTTALKEVELCRVPTREDLAKFIGGEVFDVIPGLYFDRADAIIQFLRSNDQ